MTYAEALGALDRRTNYEATGRLVAPSIDRMRALVALLDDPQNAYPVIHVTGTNGKGTTSAVASALLRETGLSVGTYTSPHLQSPRERMAYDLTAISEDEFADTFAYLEPFLARIDAAGEALTWFETITALAFVWFAERSVDAAVVEVGLGGTWDATNVAHGRVAVITKVALDHPELGSTTVEIAGEKAGIVKRGAVCVTGERDPAVVEVLRSRCATAGATMRRAGAEYAVERRGVAVGGQVVDLRVGEHRYDEVFVPLHGAALADDAATGLAAVSAFLGERPLDRDIVEAGFASVRAPGRVEVVARRPLVVVDGAHNVDAAAALAAAMRESFRWGRLTLVIGMLADHFRPAVLEALLPLADEVVATSPPSPRAMPADGLAAAIAAAGRTARVAGDVGDACAVALEHAAAGDAVLVTGSLYTVAAARPRFVEGTG